MTNGVLGQVGGSTRRHQDRSAMHMVARARLGVTCARARIIESSSGTLGLGLALAGMVYRHPVTVVTDTGLEPIIVRMLSAYGVQVGRSTNRTRKAAGNRPAATGGQLLAEDPGMESRPVQQPRQRLGISRAGPGDARPTGPHRRAGVLGGHRRPLSRGGAVLRVQSRDDADRGGHHRLDHLRATGPAPPDARPGLKHLSGQRGLRGVQRSPLVAPAESVWRAGSWRPPITRRAGGA